MAAALKQALAAVLIHNAPPDGEAFFSVHEVHLAKLVRSQGQSLRQVMIACLEHGIWPERLRPNRGAFSAGDQIRLLGSTVAVLGAGGLGGMVCLQLARLGVGRLTVCDGDQFVESNLNRQFLCSLDTLGQNKAQCAALQMARINPAVEVSAQPVFADRDNLPGLLAGAQVVLDCLDNLPARYLLEETARQLAVTYIHGAVAGLEGMVMTVRPGDPGLVGLYGPVAVAKAESAETVLGVPTPTPAMVATLQVNEAVKVLLGRPGLEPGQVLHLDLEGPVLEVLSLRLAG